MSVIRRRKRGIMSDKIDLYRFLQLTGSTCQQFRKSDITPWETRLLMTTTLLLTATGSCDPVPSLQFRLNMQQTDTTTRPTQSEASSSRSVVLPSDPAPPRQILNTDYAVAQWHTTPGFRGFWGWTIRRCDRIKGKQIMEGSNDLSCVVN